MNRSATPRSPAQQRASRDLRRARVRITAVTLGCLVAAVVVAGVILVQLYERELVRRTDAQLNGIATRVGQLLDSGFQVPEGTQTDDLVQLIGDDGAVTYAGTPLRDEAALWRPGDPTETHTISSATQGNLRIVVTRFGDEWLVFAEQLQPAEDAIRALRTTMLLGLVPLALVLGGVVWLAVGRALRPVSAAVEREEQLVADVSHELRSPLAGIRLLLETEPVGPDDVAASRAEALAVLARLESITDNLLVLTRPTGDDRRRVARPVDLDELVQVQVQQLAPRTDVEIDTGRVVAGQVVGDPDDLDSMVANLLANAVRHARRQVRVAVAEADGAVELTVDDDGSGIPEADRDLVFERFTRLDEARSRGKGGAGLGLAIVRAVVERHHGTIAVEDAPIGGARFRIRLPASTGAAAPARRPATPVGPRS